MGKIRLGILSFGPFQEGVLTMRTRALTAGPRGRMDGKQSTLHKCLHVRGEKGAPITIVCTFI